MPQQNVEELRCFVQSETPKLLSHARDSSIVFLYRQRVSAQVCALMHLSELVYCDREPVFADSRLAENNRTTRIDPDSQRNQSHQGQKCDERHPGENE